MSISRVLFSCMFLIFSVLLKQYPLPLLKLLFHFCSPSRLFNLLTKLYSVTTVYIAQVVHYQCIIVLDYMHTSIEMIQI